LQPWVRTGPVFLLFFDKEVYHALQTFQRTFQVEQLLGVEPGPFHPDPAEGRTQVEELQVGEVLLRLEYPDEFRPQIEFTTYLVEAAAESQLVGQLLAQAA